MSYLKKKHNQKKKKNKPNNNNYKMLKNTNIVNWTKYKRLQTE